MCNKDLEELFYLLYESIRLMHETLAEFHGTEFRLEKLTIEASDQLERAKKEYYNE